MGRAGIDQHVEIASTHGVETDEQEEQVPIKASRTVANLAGLAFAWLVWLWLAWRPSTAVQDALIAGVCTLAIIPLIFTGRWLLDRQHTLQRAGWVALGVRYLLTTLFGAVAVATVRFGLASLEWPLPVHPWLGPALILVSALALGLMIFHLLVGDQRGFGATFAFTRTRTVVTGWLCAWVCNPLSCETCFVSALAFLVGLGLWLRSGLFLVWVLAVVSPALLAFLRMYEERELEMRFG